MPNYLPIQQQLFKFSESSLACLIDTSVGRLTKYRCGIAEGGSELREDLSMTSRLKIMLVNERSSAHVTTTEVHYFCFYYPFKQLSH